MYFFCFGSTQDYLITIRTAKDKTFLAFPPHHVETLKARLAYLMRGYRASADAAFLRVDNVQGSRMTGNTTAHKERTQPHCVYVLGNTKSIGCMGLGNTILNASVLSYVTISQVNVPKFQLRSFIDRPTHDVHHRSITQGISTLDFQLELATMVSLVTSLAQSNQVGWGIATDLAALQMVNIQNRVFALTLAVNTLVPIPCQDVLPHVPKAHLFALLILLTLDVGILDFLSIELSNLNSGLRNWKQLMSQADNLQVTLDLLFNTGCYPTIFLLAVIKTNLAVTCLAVSPCPSQLPASRKQIHNIIS